MSHHLFQVAEHIIPSQHIREYPGATREDQEDVLHIHIKQYTPREAPDPTLPAITILSCHGNGFPKECQEALWDELLSRAKANAFSISSIWIADPTHQGLSYVLNEDKLSDDPSWLDHTRDTLLMVNHFRHEMKRPIVGVGHSMGGNQLINLALMHPRLMAALVLLDPVIVPYTQVDNGQPARQPSLTLLSSYRRDLWPSRDEAAIAIRRAPMYKIWDDRAWAAFVRHGLRDLPTAIHPDLPEGATAAKPPVTLTTPPTMEVHHFMRPNYNGLDADSKPVIHRKTHADVFWAPGQPVPYPFYRPEPQLVWGRLPSVRPPALFILGADSWTTDDSTKDAHKLIGTGQGGSGGEAEGRAKRVILDGVGHGVPFEAPARAADACAAWLGPTIAEWKADEVAWLAERKARPARDHLVLDDAWKKHIGQRPSANKSGKAQPKM